MCISKTLEFGHLGMFMPRLVFKLSLQPGRSWSALPVVPGELLERSWCLLLGEQHRPQALQAA